MADVGLSTAIHRMPWLMWSGNCCSQNALADVGLATCWCGRGWCGPSYQLIIVCCLLPSMKQGGPSSERAIKSGLRVPALVAEAEEGGPSSERAIESGLRVPALVAEAMELYAQRYTALKAPRKLHWKPHVGCVEMQVGVSAWCCIAFKDARIASR
eukprot:1160316-Pelagomonas_calceolata.AAC.14